MSQPLLPPPPPKKSYAIMIAAAIIAVAVISVVFVYGIGGLQQVFPSIMPPSVQVTSKNARTGFMYVVDFTVWIDVSIYNGGGRGTVTVWAKVYEGNNFWAKSQIVTLEAKESRNLTFEFSEPTISWPNKPESYAVWIG